MNGFSFSSCFIHFLPFDLYCAICRRYLLNWAKKGSNSCLQLIFRRKGRKRLGDECTSHIVCIRRSSKNKGRFIGFLKSYEFLHMFCCSTSNPNNKKSGCKGIKCARMASSADSGDFSNNIHYIMRGKVSGFIDQEESF